ncbi:hypothetical protein [Burkholderia phage FLC9]|nr:hypothetical protein [Burkholderia phage FLC9]
MANTLQDLQRQQEILFDISMDVGVLWNKLSKARGEELMDMVGGSRGMFDHVKAWVDEFDAAWEARDEDNREDYLYHVSEFTRVKFEELETRAIRLGSQHALNEMRRPYIVRLDAHMRKAAALSTLSNVLTDDERAWMFGSSERLRYADDLDKMNRVTHDMAMLVSKLVVELHARGITYVKMAEVLELSVGRTRQLADRYARVLRLKWEDRLPWKAK